MRKIALRGLLGQKRDTLLLWSVVTLAFLFLTLSTTIITSLQKNDEQQRIATYGRWQVIAGDCTQQQAQAAAAQAQTAAAMPMVNVAGTNYFSGGNTYYLGVYSPELAELGSFQLKEGRWPETSGEVVLEYAQLSALGLAVGDSFTVTSELSMPETQESLDAREARMETLRQQICEETFVSLRDECLQAWRSGAWRNMLEYRSNLSQAESFFVWWDTMGNCVFNAHLFADEAHPDGQILGFGMLTEEQFLLALSAFWQKQLAQGGLLEDEMIARMTPEEQRYSTGITDVIGSGQRNMRVRIKDGVMQLAIPTTFTVCGVVETVSDRWDVGALSLPGGYMTQECYEEIVACQAQVLEKYDYFHPVAYNWLVLAEDGAGDARALWQRMADVYNASIPNGFYSFFYAGDTVRGFPQYANWQYGVTFTLGDPAQQSFVPVQGWVCPAAQATPKWYISDRQVDVGIESAADAEGMGLSVGAAELCANIPAIEEATVRFYYNGESYAVPWAQFITGEFAVEGLQPLTTAFLWSSAMDAPADSTALRLNRHAGAAQQDGSGRMLVLVTVILFVTTACAVFQIFFSQMRRRLRRIILMKAIGATAGQIARMLVWEFVYFLLASLPAGTLLGLGGAKLAAQVLSGTQGRQMAVYVSQPVLAAALGAGTLALALGMLIPIVMAVGVPLTGRTVRKKPLPPPKREMRQTFFRVTLRGLAANRSRTAGNALLCVFMMLITTLCLFLGVQFLAPWREAVQRDGKPEYLLRSPYAMSDRQQQEYLAELEALGVCAGVSVYRSAAEGEVLLAAEAVVESPLIKAAFDAPVTIGEDFDGYPVSLYSFTSQDTVYKALASAVTVGTPDAAAFDAGKQVILAVPLYRESDAGLETTFYAEYDDLYLRDTALQAGDTLRLAAQTRMVDTVNLLFYTRMGYADVQVGGILYYFPDEGVWPFSGGEGYQLLCSPRVLGELLPNAVHTRTSSEARALRAGFTTGTGATEFYVNGADGISREEIDTALLIFARSHYMDIEFYHESSDKLLQDAVNNILLTCLLGLTAALLALLIFANTVTSDVEAERSRLGILQALGVSDRRLTGRQLCIGLCASGLAVVLANGLLWGGTALYCMYSGAVPGNLLWHYPTGLHAGVCAAMVLLITLLYAAPMRALRRYLPIENIKSRK